MKPIQRKNILLLFAGILLLVSLALGVMEDPSSFLLDNGEINFSFALGRLIRLGFSIYIIIEGGWHLFTNLNTIKKDKKPTTKKNNKNAIIGFVLSAISIFGVGLAGIIGMIFGIVALTQIKHTHEKGKGWAIAAIVIGLIWGFGIGILRRMVEMGY